jgi:hypothetical protein
MSQCRTAQIHRSIADDRSPHEVTQAEPKGAAGAQSVDALPSPSASAFSNAGQVGGNEALALVQVSAS